MVSPASAKRIKKSKWIESRQQSRKL